MESRSVTVTTDAFFTHLPKIKLTMNVSTLPVRQRGIALIIVLMMLVLLSGLVVAFLTTVGHERVAANASASGTTTSLIADSTLNFVLAQLRDATSQPGENVTWSSQPGAIRTFSGKLSNTKKNVTSSGGASGGYFHEYTPSSDDYVYKLYSADKMRPRTSEYNSADLPAEVKVIENWNPKKPEPDHVDLNQPSLSVRTDLNADGSVVEPRYPIIDPRAKYTSGEQANGTGNSGIVDGFDAKITTDPQLKFAKAGGGVGAAVPYLPMPVKWLYVLKDMTVGPASRATETNPIIGRTAFWTDDEASKLNINTASEGTFWDTPSQSTEQESGQVDDGSGPLQSTAQSLSLASSQPVRGEYQRYGGHPATTSLSPVLGWLWGITPNDSIMPNGNETYRAFKQAIYQILPFMPYGYGTTEGATKNTDQFFASTVPVLEIPTKHLYATVDELMFAAQRTTGGLNGRPMLNSWPNPTVTPSALEKVRFFLSANSRSPELNLFGRPRVTIWPVNNNYQQRTPFDELFAFTSTISKDASGNEANDVRYYLTREDAKSDKKDYEGSAQNKKMYKFLQDMTSSTKPIPGFGGTFEAKYAADRDQILTEIFDYMRTVNLVDTGYAARSANAFAPYTPRYYPAGTLDDYRRPARSLDWSGQVTPLKIGTSTSGMGRFLTVVEAALVFHRFENDKFQAVLVLEMATPMAGYPAIRETYFTKVKAVTPLKIGIGGAPVAEAAFCTKQLINICNISSHECTFGRGFMPTLGCSAPFLYYPEHPAATSGPDGMVNRNTDLTVAVKNFNSSGAESYSRGSTVQNYPYVSKVFTVSGNPSDFTFVGPELAVEIWSGEAPDDSRAAKIQTIRMKFPSNPLTLPFPGNRDTFQQRLSGTINSVDGAANSVISSNDVIRSIELTGGAHLPLEAKGDLRIAMCMTDVPSSFFEPRDGESGYNDTSRRQVHGLNNGHGDRMPGHSGDSTVAAGGTNNVKPPILPKGINGVRRSDGVPGDWDRGISKHMNGAMSNKVDEGNTRFRYSDSRGGRMPYYRGRAIEETGQSYFTPNRQLPSAVMLGSLPTGVKANKPWQTLLFRPDRESGSNGHPGAKTSVGPSDHLFLDLFQLPVIEPYAISEPFSTAGKVNMNYVIAPFGYAKGDSGNVGTMNKKRSYIRRDTAVRGVLKSTFMMAIPNSEPDAGHTESPLSTNQDKINRFPLDLDKTIEAMEARLNDQSVALASRPMTLFRSASEICEIDLFPNGLSVNGSWASFWEDNYGMTGDNMRERPYAHLFPRFTTKSNVFTVHMRCQAIKKAPGTSAGVFDPEKDQIVGEYRGASIVERFIDPNDPNLKGYDHSKDKVDDFYRYRVVATKRFAPR